MQNSYLKMLTFCAAILLTAPESIAQTSSTEVNPMDYAKSLHTANTTNAGSKSAFRKGGTANSADYFSYNYGTETSTPKKIADKLTTKYGPPKTGRGDLKVWEVKNAQQQNVTIMVGSNSAGSQEFIIDQRRPANYRQVTRKISTEIPVPSRSVARRTVLSQERD